MAIEIRDRTEDTVETAVMGADLVTGAAVTVADSVTRAVTHPVREARKIERRGAAANKQINRDVAEFIDDAGEAIGAVMPEKVALYGLHAIKDRARRKDFVGDLAYRALEIVNGGLEAVASTLNRLERASQPPTRPGTSHTRPARPVAKAARRAKRTVGSTAKSTRSTARRGTARARRTERKSA